MRIAAAVIAGGKATRMGGVVKGLLRDVGGTSIIERLLDQAAAADVTDIVISANEREPYAAFNLPIIADRLANIGPLGGIEAVVTYLARRCDCVLLLPCDLPNVTADEILRLVRAYEASSGRLVVAHTTEGDHPLCAVVPVSVLDKVRAAIGAGAYGVGRLWRSLDALPVEIDDSARMMNVNTPEDVRTWRRASQPPKQKGIDLSDLTHVDAEGRAHMVNVGGKKPQRRLARASGMIRLARETCALIRENRVAKGNVLTVAQIAGIQAAKRTGELIPLCHPLGLDHVDVVFELGEDHVTATGEASCTGRTGVEMEALTAVSVALLTIYDMCKAVDKQMQIGPIALVEKVKFDDET